MRRVPLPVDLDLLQARRRVSVAGWGLLVAGLVACAVGITAFRQASAEIDEREVAMLHARDAARRATPAAAGAKDQVGADEAKAALGVAARLNADWGGMIGGVAAAQGDGVTWVSLQADQARGGLNVSGVARSLAEVFEFLARLGEVPGVRDARLASYEWVQVGSRDAVQFTANAKWSARP